MSEPFIGTVMLWAPPFAPRGWAFCKGQLLPINTYQALFTLIGTSYGGDGMSTFALPNLQGRAPIGAGQLPGGSTYEIGQTGGTETKTLTTTNLPSHTHAAQFTGTQSLSVDVTIKATSDPATKDAPEAGMQLGDVSPSSVKVYAPAGAKDKEIDLAGGTGTVTGSIGGTVTVLPAGSSESFSIASPYQTLNYVIALQGIYPTRE